MDENLRNICSFILNRETMTNLKLQKILYFIQATQLLRTGNVAFNSTIEAWPYGPVVPEVYFAFKNGEIIARNNIALPEVLNQTVNDVVDNFRSWNEFQMVDLTHKYQIWIDRIRDPFSSKIMLWEDILNYHSSRSGSPF